VQRIVECSDVRFDEDSTPFTQDLKNKDPLRLPPEEPIYEEVQIQPLAAMAPDKAAERTPDKVVAARIHEPGQTVRNEPVQAVRNELVQAVRNEPVQAVRNEPGQTVSNMGRTHEPTQAMDDAPMERTHEPAQIHETANELEHAVDSALRRSKRIKKRKADTLVADTDVLDTGPPPKDTDPCSYHQAMASGLRKQW